MGYEDMSEHGWIEEDLFLEPSTYSGAPDECSIHWPKKPNECECEEVKEEG